MSLAAEVARKREAYGYYISTRYPNGLPDSIPARVYTSDAAQGSAALAEDVVTYVQQLLEENSL